MYPHYNIHPLFDTLPTARQKTYLKVAQSDHSLAQDLYLWNLETTSAVFQTISFVEVTMRNVFDKQLRTWNNIGVNGNSNWIVHLNHSLHIKSATLAVTLSPGGKTKL